MRKLLTWLGVDENTRQMLTIEALRIKDTVELDVEVHLCAMQMV